MRPSGGKPGTNQRRKGRKHKRAAGNTHRGDGPLILFGSHAVEAAVKNPARRVHTVFAPQGDTARIEALRPGVQIQPFTDDIARQLPAGAVHQRIAAAVDPLDAPALEALLELEQPDTLLMLDQVTDPHNVGAIFRSAAAFGAGALICQERHTPGETGTMARAASGMLEQVPWVRVTNLSRALEQLQDAGYWSIGLDGRADEHIEQAVNGHQKLCLVLGAEGAGLRQNVRAHCSSLARLEMAAGVESLNVSNAAAVALYISAKR